MIIPTKKCLVICPTLRKDKFLRMYQSFIDTANNSDLISVSTEGPTTELINTIYESFPDYEFYSVTNDDFIYHTYDWDNILMCHLKSPGIAYGDDGMNKSALPTTSIISGALVRALGWLQFPGADYLFGDTAWGVIGRKLNILHYIDSVKIEHLHYCNNKAEMDGVYAKTNNKARYALDGEHFKHWLVTECGRDIERLRRVLELEMC